MGSPSRLRSPADAPASAVPEYDANVRKSLVDHIITALNTATESQNKIHDDEVARHFGFRGGLVPGVDVYAYLTHPAVHRWGRDWLERGTMTARFLIPVYDGEITTIHGEDEPAGAALVIEALDPAGAICATAEATLPTTAPPPDPDAIATRALAEGPLPRATPDSLAPGTVLGTIEVGFHADRAAEYLADVREDLAVYREEGIAHPGWLLRQANAILVANVALGPWIHVGSDVRYHAALRDGRRLSTRAAVLEEYERKGHRFVELDVLQVDDLGTVISRCRHTAIYEPRGT